MLLHPYMKNQISQQDLWTWSHEMPTQEEMQRRMEQHQKEQDEWNVLALDYLRRKGLIYDN